MTVYLDPTETRSNSKMPNIPDIVLAEGLEQLTGCDIMVSHFGAPIANEMLIRKHVENGALLIQRKHGLDLSASIGSRLNSSLAKMQSVGAKPWQSILLFIGVLTQDDEERGIINRQDTHRGYWTIKSALSLWNKRGGVFEQISKASDLHDWLKMQSRQLQKCQDEPTKEFHPTPVEMSDKSELLQILVPVTDARVLLATIPGIGPKTSSQLWQEFNQDAGAILCWLTDPMIKHKMKVKGIGARTFEKVRQYLNLDQDMMFSMQPIIEMYPQLYEEEKELS